MIATNCSACNDAYDVDEGLAGKSIRCRRCGDTIWVRAKKPCASTPSLSVRNNKLVLAAVIIVAGIGCMAGGAFLYSELSNPGQEKVLGNEAAEGRLSQREVIGTTSSKNDNGDRLRQEEERRQQQAADRQREADEDLRAQMKNPTLAEIEDVAAYPDRYLGKALVFDLAWMDGGLDRDKKNGGFSVSVKSSRGKRISGFLKNGLWFGFTEEMGQRILKLANDHIPGGRLRSDHVYHVYLCCAIISPNKQSVTTLVSTDPSIEAMIYRVGFYNGLGEIVCTVEE